MNGVREMLAERYRGITGSHHRARRAFAPLTSGGRLAAGPSPVWAAVRRHPSPPGGEPWRAIGAEPCLAIGAESCWPWSEP